MYYRVRVIHTGRVWAYCWDFKGDWKLVAFNEAPTSTAHPMVGALDIATHGRPVPALWIFTHEGGSMEVVWP